MSQILTGTVVSNKMEKTIVVDIARRFQHPRLRKTINVHKKLKAHVPGDLKVNFGDIVRIRQTRPISKDKHFILITENDQEVKQEPKKKVQTEEKQVVVKKAVEKAPKTTTKKAAVRKTAVKKVTKKKAK